MKDTNTYQALSAQLDGILDKLQDPNIQVDEAVELYKQGIELVAKLEKHLEQAENKLQTLKLAKP